MSSGLYHEFTRVPITALAYCGPYILAAEGSDLLFYHGLEQKYLARKAIFQGQAIHGILRHNQIQQQQIVVIWGGPYIRVLTIENDAHLTPNRPLADELHFSAIAKATDWILDLAFSPDTPGDTSGRQTRNCAAVTAHNALLLITIEAPVLEEDNTPVLYVSDLSPSSRSILYSAHLLWEIPDRILIAAGTAFGEIILWSWTRRDAAGAFVHTHSILLGHEGSIFGVQISKEFEWSARSKSQRFLASCSDDRTIRVWDISRSLAANAKVPYTDEGHDTARSRHTGFSNALFDSDSGASACIAIGWGHLSRVWHIRFLDTDMVSQGVTLLSSGEDATSRLWKLAPKQTCEGEDIQKTFDLNLIDTSAFHNGKNIWATTMYGSGTEHSFTVTGGADSKITKRSLASSCRNLEFGSDSALFEYSVDDIRSMAEAPTEREAMQSVALTHRSSAMSEFLRSYAFIGDSSFLLTTNSGKVYIEDVNVAAHSVCFGALSTSRLVGDVSDLAGYSLCTAVSSCGIGFVAGSRGSLHLYQASTNSLSKFYSIQGKVGSMFATKTCKITKETTIALLVTILGQKSAQLLYVDTAGPEPAVSRSVNVPLSDPLTGLVISSLAYIKSGKGEDYVILGFRKGAVGLYTIPKLQHSTGSTDASQAKLFRVVERVHGKETVTSICWRPSGESLTTGDMITVGRDGCCAVHHIDLASNHVILVHNLSLAMGPNIEGCYFHGNHFMVYGFTSKQFILLDVTSEEELMSIDTGGAHRSWAFQPAVSEAGGGISIWTRASGMHVYTQSKASHEVMRPGGHGREIKAVAASASSAGGEARQLVATGAEDTDIKLFEFADGELVCRSTLRKHTTGIQHLQWSDDGQYLFSSGGCEEFYIWRVRRENAILGIHVVCESVCQPEGEHSDVRAMSFDVKKREDGQGFLIAMVFSDSNMKVCSYDPTSAVKWLTLAKSVYFTSCLTQCAFLAPTTILTAGTDGHAVLWPLPAELHRPHTSTPLPGRTLKWRHPARIHQSTSKTLATHSLESDSTLIVSGGDDASLAFLLVSTSSGETTYAYPPIIVLRAHASAVTACSVLQRQGCIFVLTSGNDQWVRLWELVLRAKTDGTAMDDPFEIKRVKKIKTSVADVSSMTVLAQGDEVSKVMMCGVGMEVVRVAWT